MARPRGGETDWTSEDYALYVWGWWTWNHIEGDRQVIFSRSREKVSFRLPTLPESSHHQLKAHRHLLRAGATKTFLIHGRNTASPLFLSTSYIISLDPPNKLGKWVILSPTKKVKYLI